MESGGRLVERKGEMSKEVEDGCCKILKTVGKIKENKEGNGEGGKKK